MELIRTENVVKNYGSTEVLKGVSLNIREREFVGIMGKSGSGKTTLLKILGMTEPVTDGELMYRGKRAQELSDKESARIRREELGFVFQEFFLMDSLDILENVMLPLLISKDADGKVWHQGTGREDAMRAVWRGEAENGDMQGVDQ